MEMEKENDIIDHHFLVVSLMKLNALLACFSVARLLYQYFNGRNHMKTYPWMKYSLTLFGIIIFWRYYAADPKKEKIKK